MKCFLYLPNKMPTLIELKLYTTSHCHLCDQAIELLSKQQNIILTIIEIADSDDLIQLYGSRIPVLQRLDNPFAVLNWPFNHREVLNFIQAC
jgi:hypothetical protein